MRNIEVKLQNIMLANDARFAGNESLFYRGSNVNIVDNIFCINECECVKFDTYINSLSLDKWKKYTYTNDIKLKLIAEGTFWIDKYAYVKDGPFVERVELGMQKICLPNKSTVSVEFEDIDATLLCFDIRTDTTTKIYNGYYFSEIDETFVRDIDIAIATTTYKKEEYILSNINMIKEQLLESKEEISSHVFVHVVDNGATLNKKDIECHSNIYLHENINAGGSGGFARGMIEVIKQNQHGGNISHLILMDDDVIIFPEAIIRTYNLMKILKTDYHDYFVNGAMLELEDMTAQHENLAFCHELLICKSLNQYSDISKVRKIIYNEDEGKFIDLENLYAAWWYCVIPIKYVNKDNLPLPFFIRLDDLEYGIRNNSKYISLNGICLWHMGFKNKYRASLSIYQEQRNFLIIKTIHDLFEPKRKHKLIERVFREQILRFNYAGAKMALDAFEDYIKGPEILISNKADTIIQQKYKDDEKYIDATEDIKEKYEEDDLIYNNPARTNIQRKIYKWTMNGLLIPKILLSKQDGVAYYGPAYNPNRYYLKKNIITVNPHNDTYVVRTLQKRKAFTLFLRYIKLLCKYKINRKRIEKMWKESFKHITSIKFWEDYLNLK